MQNIRVEGVPLPVPALVMGTMRLNPRERGSAFDLLDSYAAEGGSAFDTAHVYGGGDSERVLGMWMKARGNRTNCTVITKGCHPRQDGRPRVTEEAIRQDLDESLDRLQTDYIDLYLLHRDDEGVPVAPIVEALNAEISRGRIRSFGASNWRTVRIAEANGFASERGLRGFAASSINLALTRPQVPVWPGCLSADDSDLAWHRKTRIPLLSWSPQAQGFFAEKYASGTPMRDDLKALYDTQDAIGRRERARELGRKRGFSANQIALAWVLARPFPVAAVIGPRTIEQLQDSLGTLKVALSPAEAGLLEGR